MAIRNIIFDWSGTISNDILPVYLAAMAIFRNFGLAEIPQEQFMRTSVIPYLPFYQRYVPSISKEEVDTIFIDAIMRAPHPVPFDGIGNVLRQLSLSKNCIVMSSHPHQKLLSEARQYGFLSYFQEIYGGIPDKTEVIRDIMKQHGFLQEETAYVGDMDHDILAGTKAGVITVAVTWGYHDEKKLAACKPLFIARSLPELQQLLIS
ncbi:HAD family hydrolase [Candidatus Woesearchaeota archaeon]|nr:HAD family hydrolase [Candidatus Woesearchaeota archaeon]